MDEHLTFLKKCSCHAKPADSIVVETFKPCQTIVSKIVELRDSNRASKYFNHLSVISEGVQAFNWVFVTPAPAPFVNEIKGSAQFYSNRVLKEFKDHNLWCRAFVQFFDDLSAYIKAHHTTGISWNKTGTNMDAGDTESLKNLKPIAEVKKPATGSIFSELSKGDQVTSGLKKVEKSMMTHKNTDLRASSVVKAKEVKKETLGKPAKVALEGHKWAIENVSNDQNVQITDTNLKQTVYIYNCVNSVISVKGKVNAITLDNCKKTSIVLDSTLSTIDVINCKSVQAQILGTTPTISIDKTDGMNLFLNPKCLDIQVYSSKSSEMNISIPGATSEDDYVERPIPEQFKTEITKDGELSTTMVSHTG